jgi:hypothetical protein
VDPFQTISQYLPHPSSGISQPFPGFSKIYR